MTTIAADSWTVSIGGGWIVLMLIGMGLCFVFMFGFMSLMRNGRGWTMCGRWWQQETPPEERPGRSHSRSTSNAATGQAIRSSARGVVEGDEGI
jgi:hypothetical protein